MPPCNTIPSVITSADANQNTGLGGHLTAHIYGMNPPAGYTQNGRTLFAGRGKWESVWRQYRLYIPLPVNCGGGAAAHQLCTLAQLHIAWLDAYACTAADGAGRCTQYTLYMADSVRFGFAQVGGQWILNSAWPIYTP